MVLGALATIMATSGAAMADWKYDATTDKMTGKSGRTASLTSENSLALDFPYRGTNHGHLTVRQHPKYGLDVVLQVQKGQILCSSYAGCPVEIKFDDAKPVRFSGTEPADHSSDTVFINNPEKFIAAAQKAKTILVQVNMYQAGAPVLEFKSSTPLEWTNKKPQTKGK